MGTNYHFCDPITTAEEEVQKVVGLAEILTHDFDLLLNRYMEVQCDIRHN